ncbi:MAG TPA: 3-phosphoshikimate 1-carboxyvinyltransferase [Candidatus Glassbacteria bacterium]|nr:3-phosphoshikimate 1-carboxyvinyltransferase [Candidatus Glassbacteria bacterium]
MIETIIRPTQHINGTISAPPSKAYTQRMLIASALSYGRSIISDPLFSEDTEATYRAVKSLGAEVKVKNNLWVVNGSLPLQGKSKPIDCGESGATLRFILPVSGLADGSSLLTFGKSLEKRPIAPLLQSLQDLGVKTETRKIENKSGILVFGGGINGGRTLIRGDVSSQFISGLMFACPLANSDTVISLSTPLESKAYVEMTREVLAKHGILFSIADNYDQLHIQSNQIYQKHDHKVPGDFSSAAFLLVAATITNSNVIVQNLDSSTLQGDKAILEILKQMGVIVKVSENQVEIGGYDGLLKPIDIDARDIPDLVPICATLACFANGTSKIHDANRLRYKESDRLLSLYLELRKMGANISMDKTSLVINGPCVLKGAAIDPHNDHRIAMACSVAALMAVGQTKIQNSECVKKSYPEFFNDLRKIGADVVGGKFDR